MDEYCFFTFLSSFLLFDVVGFSILLGLPLIASHLLIPYEETVDKLKKITKIEKIEYIPIEKKYPRFSINIILFLFCMMSLSYIFSAVLIMFGFLGWECWYYGVVITIWTTLFTIILLIAFFLYRAWLMKTKLVIDLLSP
jgi:hypothetical protein